MHSSDASQTSAGHAHRPPHKHDHHGHGDPDHHETMTGVHSIEMSDASVAGMPAMGAAASGTMPALPEIGHVEAWYAKRVHHAERHEDPHARAGYKVGQYITLALASTLGWEEKLKFFRHALKRHCAPPPFPDDEIWMFYQQLANLVRQHAGQEALRIASTEDDLYAARLTMGQDRDHIENDAEQFFSKLMTEGDHCPNWFNEDDWATLKLIRDQWI